MLSAMRNSPVGSLLLLEALIYIHTPLSMSSRRFWSSAISCWITTSGRQALAVALLVIWSRCFRWDWLQTFCCLECFPLCIWITRGNLQWTSAVSFSLPVNVVRDKCIIFQFTPVGFSCGESITSMGRTRRNGVVRRSVFHQRRGASFTGWAHHYSMPRCQRVNCCQRCDDCYQGARLLCYLR